MPGPSSFKVRRVPPPPQQHVVRGSAKRRPPNPFNHSFFVHFFRHSQVSLQHIKLPLVSAFSSSRPLVPSSSPISPPTPPVPPSLALVRAFRSREERTSVAFRRAGRLCARARRIFLRVRNASPPGPLGSPS